MFTRVLSLKINNRERENVTLPDLKEGRARSRLMVVKMLRRMFTKNAVSLRGRNPLKNRLIQSGALFSHAPLTKRP